MKDEKIVLIHKQAPWGVYYSEDNLLIKYLKSHFNLEVITWENVDPLSLEGHTVLLRCPNNYLSRINVFKKWYTLAEKYSSKIINPSKSVLFGLSKTYLFELQKAGVKIVPSVLFSSDNLPVEMICNWKNVIIKPVYGESGVGVKHKTNSLSKKTIECYIAKYGDCIVQKYFPEINSFGEISTYFINNKYLYSTISRTPSDKEFKVSWNLVGQYYPGERLIKLAENAYKQWAHPLNYARLDWLKSGDSYFLSEFEVIDPMFNLKSINDKTRKCLFGEIAKMLK